MNNAKVVQSNEIVKRKAWNTTDIKDYIGKKFGRLIIIRESDAYVSPRGSKRTKVIAKCECGIIKSYTLNSLKKGNNISCGCFKIELIKKTLTTHGAANKDNQTNEYKIWAGIKTRCTNKNNEAYKDYGGRGISMCNEWLNDFPQFLTDMGYRPSKSHSIERNDVDGDYTKNNCRWATIHEQAANRRNSNKTVGVRYDESKGKWSARLFVKGELLFNKRFETEVEAIQARKEAEIKHGILI